jgi:hypothetical protein
MKDSSLKAPSDPSAVVVGVRSARYVSVVDHDDV